MSNAIKKILSDVPLPSMVGVRQKFVMPDPIDVEKTFLHKIQSTDILSTVKKGDNIAIAVGSRGISNMRLIVELLGKVLSMKGAKPFIVPAMGSHGGATADGQENVLKSLGISHDSTGIPVRSSMEAVQIGTTETGLPVLYDKLALEADGLILVNRIKPHVSFRGDYESGIMKMIAIGLGKQKGAEICHQLGFDSMERNILDMGSLAIHKGNIILAVGLLEDAEHNTAKVEIIRKEDILNVEPRLLEEAWKLLPKLYINDLDVLIMDEIGKDISGTGFDTNIVGRYYSQSMNKNSKVDTPNISMLVALDITQKSGGNANGIGLVDVISRRAFDKIRFEHTYPNALTTTMPLGIKIPMVMENDSLAIRAAIKMCNTLDMNSIRLGRIKNTISVSEIELSANLINEIKNNPNTEITTDEYRMQFDNLCNLI